MQRNIENKKSKSVERTLLVSALSIVLCCGVLFGTAYAWMMDSVSHDVAIIQAGTLEVDMVDAPKNGKSFIIKDGASQAESTVPLVFTKVVTGDGTQAAESGEQAEESIRVWDVGETYQLPAMYVVNKGTTDLTYTISIEGIEQELADGIKVNPINLIDFTIKINGVEPESVGTSATGDLQIFDNPDTAEADESKHQIIISGELNETVALSNYQGMKFEGITIKIDAVQTVQ